MEARPSASLSRVQSHHHHHKINRIGVDEGWSSTYRRVRRPADDEQYVVILRRSPPLFTPAMWNVHQVTPDGEQRTNNLCGAWNCRNEHLCGVCHPSVWKLLHWLKADSVQCFSR
ncbi:hypothetical protein LSH36_127g05028 [Paralvinella palmiformis]|uniref:Uncharacterized protein n=1 Tax=Paralvinella palmiformis TaxID=53620 RepID=A0AAD9N8H0_9ANNE|nr:hypothetical protein LSH36_127g05028 [Paralvinella palmiformis]